MSAGEAAVSLPGPFTKLTYDVTKWSSFSSNYHPRNILVDRPSDQSSRWSSGTNDKSQFLLLELPAPAVVTEITFGKFLNPHVCNLRHFKIYGGLTESCRSLLLDSGLHNDSFPETFPLRYSARGVLLACKYIKIVPLMVWGESFNYSIWYLALKGVNDPAVVDKAVREHTRLQEQEALRLCLKHLRHSNHADVYRTLSKRCRLQLEHPFLSGLSSAIIEEGDFAKAERLLREAAEQDMLSEYIRSQPYSAVWRPIIPVDCNGKPQTGDEAPGMRGGHQMAIDTHRGVIYLLGGWDGVRDLADFWVYNIRDNRWTCLSRDTGTDGGPCARSCHKICFDEERQQLYVLGRFVESNQRTETIMQADFYRYDVSTDSWECLQQDTSEKNGPPFIYDHQMCCDAPRGKIYVFGGRVLTPRSRGDSTYSGLYSYDIPTDRWTLIRGDGQPGGGPLRLYSRLGHSMLLDREEQTLYIFAGQRHKDYLSDFYRYDIATDVLTELCRDSSTLQGPDPGFTQRATIDTHRKEVVVLSGLVKEPDSRQQDRQQDGRTADVQRTLWVYSIADHRWGTALVDSEAEVPCPRFAHQFEYDPATKTHYLFGGNPGLARQPKLRLADFWTLQLQRVETDEIVRRCALALRQQAFRERAMKNPREALRYLRSEVAEVVDFRDQEACADFQRLATCIFENTEISEEGVQEARSRLFRSVSSYFPASMREPEADITDLVSL